MGGLYKIVLPPNQEVVLAGVEGNAMEISAEFVNDWHASIVEFGLLRSPGAEECTRVLFYRNGGFNRSDLGPTHNLEKGTLERKRAHDSIITLDTSNSSS